MRASGRNSNNTLDLRLAGFNGVVDVLGGPWQNAVYRVTVPDDEPPAAALATAPFARADDAGRVNDGPLLRDPGSRVH